MGKKPHFEEYYVNGDHITRIYNMYISQTFWEKLLNYMVFFAIIFTVMSFVLEFLLGIDKNVLKIIHSASAFILAIFAMELVKEYANSKNTKHFFSRYWVDFTLVSILSFFFLFGGFLGYLNIKEMKIMQDFANNSKKGRAMYKLLLRR